MADSHSKNLDPQPKRRKDEGNPYEIYIADPRYFLAFTDGSKIKRWMEINKPLFNAFNEFELDDLSFFNEVDRHKEQYPNITPHSLRHTFCTRIANAGMNLKGEKEI